ncbi:MAG: trypsin-like peptidase domain-containing protein, partial [Planctomycetota bacterium]|nr:trypsin-like peptidase domain-containing protein [Planctomycetota bacterium]
AERRPITPRGNLADDEQSTIELFRVCSKSVVFIRTSALATDRLRTNIFEIPKGTGTGFVWDNDGHVVTNHHVIVGGKVFRIYTSDQRSFTAQVVGFSPENDLAVLKIDAPTGQFPEIPLGTSDNLQVGQKVFAIGNPFGLDQTLTTGVISGLGREFPVEAGGVAGGAVLEGMIQTDAAINPGNSGGPLLDSSGRLIGVNTAIVSPTNAYAGVGFALPVDTVNRIVPQLLRHGKIILPDLGITFHPYNQHLLQVLEKQGFLTEQTGIVVRDVIRGSTAEEAGVNPMRMTDKGIVIGDIIVRINEHPMRTLRDLYQFLDRSTVGDSIKIIVLRELGSGRPTEVELSAILKGK